MNILCNNCNEINLYIEENHNLKMIEKQIIYINQKIVKYENINFYIKNDKFIEKEYLFLENNVFNQIICSKCNFIIGKYYLSFNNIDLNLIKNYCFFLNLVIIKKNKENNIIKIDKLNNFENKITILINKILNQIEIGNLIKGDINKILKSNKLKK